jgi:DNA-binding beta-propeller fold protein YncE
LKITSKVNKWVGNQFGIRPVRAFAWMMVVGIVSLSSSMGKAQEQAQTLQLSRTIALPGVSGKFDHFAIDNAGQRLFAAATGNHSVEVIDLKTDKIVQSIGGLGKPHGLAYVAATGGLYMADGTLAELRVYTGTPLTLQGKIKLSDDADDMVYDEASHLLFVGHGGSDAANPARVAVVDTTSFSLVKNLPVATHPEALEIDPQGKRVFANIADSNEVAVIGTAAQSVEASWKLTKAAGNVPAAFDRVHKLLYVACRKPATLLLLDGGTGKEIASLPTVEGADDMFYDADLNRVYVVGGGGEVHVYQADDARGIRAIGVVRTSAGAKTALFDPELHELFVGIPGMNGHDAGVRVYTTLAGMEK